MAHSVTGIRSPYAEGLVRGPDTLPSSFTYVAYSYLDRPVWFAARVLEDPRTAYDIEHGIYTERPCSRGAVPSTKASEKPKRMSYACSPSPRTPRDSSKRRTAPVGSLMGIRTPPLSPSNSARSSRSSPLSQEVKPASAAAIGAMLLQPAKTILTPPPSAPSSSPPSLNSPTPPNANSPSSSLESSPTSASKARPWEKRLSSVAPERQDSIGSSASSISTYSYDVQVVRAARVSTHEGVLASPVLSKAASLKSRPSSIVESAGEGNEPFLAYLDPADAQDDSEPVIEIIKPGPEEASDMMWLIENVSGHQFYVSDSDIIAIAEAEHRRLRGREMRYFWPVYSSQLEFLSLRREDIRRRHRATLQRQERRSLLIEFTDQYQYEPASLALPPLQSQHEACLNAAFRSLRRSEGLEDEDVILDARTGECVVVRSVQEIRALVRGGWFECDDAFWEDVRSG